MYNPQSCIATDFIDDAEVLATMEFAAANKNNKAMIEAILEKAKDCKGLTHRKTLVLLRL